MNNYKLMLFEKLVCFLPGTSNSKNKLDDQYNHNKDDVINIDQQNNGNEINIRYQAKNVYVKDAVVKNQQSFELHKNPDDPLGILCTKTSVWLIKSGLIDALLNNTIMSENSSSATLYNGKIIMQEFDMLLTHNFINDFRDFVKQHNFPALKIMKSIKLFKQNANLFEEFMDHEHQNANHVNPIQRLALLLFINESPLKWDDLNFEQFIKFQLLRQRIYTKNENIKIQDFKQRITGKEFLVMDDAMLQSFGASYNMEIGLLMKMRYELHMFYSNDIQQLYLKNVNHGSGSNDRYSLDDGIGENDTNDSNDSNNVNDTSKDKDEKDDEKLEQLITTDICDGDCDAQNSNENNNIHDEHQIENLEDLTVKALRKRLKDIGLQYQGKKKQLIQKLVDYYARSNKNLQ